MAAGQTKKKHSKSFAQHPHHRRIDIHPQAELQDVITLLTALKDGESLPEVTGTAKEIPGEINSLNDGLRQLNSGAQTLGGEVSAVSGINANHGVSPPEG